MKKCSKCGVSKSLSEFNKRSVSSDGYNAKCKDCYTIDHRAWCAGNKEKVKSYNSTRSPRPEYEREYWHSHKKFAKYGLTAESYQQILDSQEGNCAICGKFLEEVCVDHDHSCCPGVKSCGRCVRGFLCRRCNAGLGSFDDDPVVLAAALNYLESSVLVPSRR